MALHLEVAVGEPGGKEQSHADLRNKVRCPQNDGVFQACCEGFIVENRSEVPKQVEISFGSSKKMEFFHTQSPKVGKPDHEGIDDRIEGKHKEGNDKRYGKYISIFCITHRFFTHDVLPPDKSAVAKKMKLRSGRVLPLLTFND
ncbi:MAG TPA: hypothetical protein PKN79_02250 [Sphaerochaeta sp.]|nr:hypothetical protein [Sphaerochaeta sp.]